MRFVCSRGPATPDYAGDLTAERRPEGGEREPQISLTAQIRENASCPKEIVPGKYDFEVP